MPVLKMLLPRWFLPPLLAPPCCLVQGKTQDVYWPEPQIYVFIRWTQHIWIELVLVTSGGYGTYIGKLWTCPPLCELINQDYNHHGCDAIVKAFFFGVSYFLKVSCFQAGQSPRSMQAVSEKLSFLHIYKNSLCKVVCLILGSAVSWRFPGGANEPFPKSYHFLISINIAKDTMDLRVEFCLPI